MSAFVDLCFGDFTERETLAFLSGELSPDQAHIAKTAYAELCQSPEGSQSEKDVLSLSNHTEDEPTSPEEPVIFMKQSKRKVKKKTRKRRKSNSQLSDKSSSSEEDFAPSLPVEFDVKPAEVKDDESEEKQDISPASSLVEDLEGNDGAAKIQQPPWSNLNKKPRSSSTSSSSQDGNQIRRKPSPRHAIQRGQDAGKKWKEENISDGDDSETSGENRDGPTAAGFGNGPARSTDNCGDDRKESLLKAKDPDIPSVESVKVSAEPPAPKRWADLFSKPSNQKANATVITEKPPAQNGTAKSEKAGQQKPPPSSNGVQRKKRSDFGRKDSSGKGRNPANAPVSSSPELKENSTAPSDSKQPVAEHKTQSQGSRQDRPRSGQSRKGAHDTPLAGRDPDRSKKMTQTVPHNGDTKELSFDCGSVLESRNEHGNEGESSMAAVEQEKNAEELPRQRQDTVHRNKTLVTEQSQVNLVVSHGVIDHTPEPELSSCGAQDKVSAASGGKERVMQYDETEVHESKEEAHAEDVVIPVKDADKGKNEQAQKEDGDSVNTGKRAKSPTDEPRPTEEPAATSNAGTKGKPREEKDQKAANAAPSSKGNPWQTSKKWSDLFVTSKQQDEVNSAKKVIDFKNVNGFGTNDSRAVKKEPVQKVLTLEEQEKLELALEVSEIIRKCNLNQSIGDVPYPRGLINTSNWCYVNSTLQALIACPKLVMCLRALIPVVDRLKTMAPYSGAIVELLKEFQYMEVDWSAPRKRMPEVKGPPFEPQGVYRALERLSNHLTTAKEHHQHDAEEYLTTSLGRIDHELTELLEMAAQHSDPAEEEEEVQSGGVWKEVYKKNKSTVTRRITANNTPITQIFGGEFRSYIYRNNKVDSSMVEPFLTLSLSVDGGVMSIEESLRKDFGKEDVIGEEESVVTKKLLFERLPNVMIIQLKKFSYDSSNGCVKLKKNLAFYDELIIDKDLMSPFVSAKYSAEKDRSYRLCAVLYHAGRNAYCGHYITAAKYIQQWLLFDDNLVRNIALKRVLQPDGKEPYILFYSRG